MTESASDYLQRKIAVVGACWIWQGCDGANGYGIAIFGERRSPAHRFAWEMERGPLAAGHVLVATCRQHKCVRPVHHVALHRAEAPREYVRRGWHAAPDNRGELSGSARLTADQVLAIREQPRARGLLPVLAALHGVSTEYVRQLRQRRRWRHIGNGNRQNAMTLAQLRGLVEAREAAPDLDELATARSA